jgi:outer membrane protein TolC
LADQVVLDVTQAFLGLRQARRRIAAAESAVSQAEENLRVSTDRFQEGVALSRDVLDAEVLLVQARMSRANALADQALAAARLRKAAGE